MATGGFRFGDAFPALGSDPKPSDGSVVKYMLIERAGDNPSLVGVSPFIIRRSITNAIGEVEESRSEQGGARYVLKVRGARKIAKLLEVSSIQDEAATKIKVTEHPTLNICKVIIHAPEILHMSEDDICTELSSKQVIKVERIKKMVSGKLQNTPLLILTIHQSKAPVSIDIGFGNKKTRTYYPRPMRCLNCLTYGHTALKCNKPALCKNCSQDSHGKTDCPNPPKCASCQGPHPVTSSHCPVYKQESDIIKIKIDYDVSYPVARRLYEDQGGFQSFAEATKSPKNKNCACKCSCQSANGSSPPTSSRPIVPNKEPIPLNPLLNLTSGIPQEGAPQTPVSAEVPAPASVKGKAKNNNNQRTSTLAQQLPLVRPLITDLKSLSQEILSGVQITPLKTHPYAFSPIGSSRHAQESEDAWQSMAVDTPVDLSPGKENQHLKHHASPLATSPTELQNKKQRTFSISPTLSSDTDVLHQSSSTNNMFDEDEMV